MEMACFNDKLPRYHNGCDLNELWKKEEKGQCLTEKELLTISDAIDVVYGKIEHEQTKKWVKAQIRENKNGKLHLNTKAVRPIFLLNGKSRSDIIQEICKREQEEFDSIYKELMKENEI